MDHPGAFPIPDRLLRVLERTPQLDRAFLVGGCVRDWQLGLPSKDIDIEVYGIGYDELAGCLNRHGRTDLVGKSFGVVKLNLGDGESYDFSLPRRDSKTGKGHTGFDIEFDKSLDPAAASARRDYTINSLMYHPREGRLLDFHGGMEDLRQRRLRHTSTAFVEDPLRVLRGMQFASRFELTVAPETVELARSIADTFAELAVERVWEEFRKWAAHSRKPSIGLRFLRDCGWLKHFPELQAIDGVEQDPQWHPEGDVFTHTCHCCDAMADLPEWRERSAEDRAILMLAILCHDLGKATETRRELKRGEMRVVSPGHERAGVPLAENFLRRLGAPGVFLERIPPLVENHMACFDDPSDRAVRRLSKRLEPENIESLTLVMTADASGRPPLPRRVPEWVGVLRERAVALQVHAAPPKPFVQGRDLIKMGLSPGPQFSELLQSAFDAQLNGEFTDLDGGLAWMRRLLAGASARQD